MEMKKLLSVLDSMEHGRVTMFYENSPSHEFEIEINCDEFEHDLLGEDEKILETLILGERGEIKIATYHIKQFNYDDRGDFIHTLEIITDVGTFELKHYVQWNI